MLLKTKLLLSLGTLGIAGGTGTGIYYLKNKSSDETITSTTEKVKNKASPISTENTVIPEDK